jgi:NAD(P)-dependent dehydrogenase (short-subunit alcohol dehydrogenase family)
VLTPDTQGVRRHAYGALDQELGFTLPDGSVLGRRGKPEEVAKLIRFLLSSDSSYTTGSIYSIDGGALC